MTKGEMDMSTESPVEYLQPIPPSELPLEDIRATEPVPDRIKHALSRRPLDLFIGDRRATPAELCAALEGSDELELPDGFSTELAATPTIIDLAELDSSEQISTGALPGYRPPWVDLVYHPRSLPSAEMPYLRTADGARVKPSAVIGREDRQQIGPYGYPWQCIGQVAVVYTHWFSGARHVRKGTAVLVGRRTILTAAHIMPGRGLFQPQPPLDWSATFAAAHTDDFVPFVPVARVTKAAVISWGQSVSSTDMMVMQLDRPVGDEVGFLPVRAYDDSWEGQPIWTHVGYPASFGGISPYRQEQIHIYDDEVGDFESEELYSVADSSDGDSGGPLFGWLSTFHLFPKFEFTPPRADDHRRKKRKLVGTHR
jgi:hypothetical protein